MQENEFDSTVSELPPLVRIKRTAQFLDAHPQTVRDLRRSGELIGVQRRAKQGSPILITRDSIRDYLTRNAL